MWSISQQKKKKSEVSLCKKNLKQIWLLVYRKKNKTHKRSNRMLFNRTIRGKMHIFKESPLFFFQATNITKTNNEKNEGAFAFAGWVVSYQLVCVPVTQQQRPEPPTVTVAWHASKYKVHKSHQSCSWNKFATDLPGRSGQLPGMRIGRSWVQIPS